jgi:hypothetical protein
MAVRYRHTQVGGFILAVTVPAMVLAAVLALQQSVAAGLLVTAVVAVVAASLFSLTTIVSDEDVQVRFGIGLISRRIPLRTVVNAVAVRNPWYYGWGIRLTHRGWLWNISGFGGVELTFVHGGHFRIGTDEPERLAAEIQRAMKSAKSRLESAS